MKASRHMDQQNRATKVSGTKGVRFNYKYAYYVYKIRDEVLNNYREP